MWGARQGGEIVTHCSNKPNAVLGCPDSGWDYRSQGVRVMWFNLPIGRKTTARLFCVSLFKGKDPSFLPRTLLSIATSHLPLTAVGAFFRLALQS